MGIHNAVSADMIAGTGALGKNYRGINVYHLSELFTVDAQSKDGRRHRVKYEQPLFYLTINERAHIFKQCAPIFGIVTSRMNRISGLEWKVQADSKVEDRKAEVMRYLYGIYDDFRDDVSIRGEMVKKIIITELKKTLFDLKPDASNFDRALLRWSKMLRYKNEDRSSEIEEWISRPNPQDDFEEITKKQVFDLMIHGSTTVYKKKVNGVLQYIYTLAGGTVVPVKEPVVGGISAYVQIVDNFNPLLYFDDELYYANYVPTTYQAHGMVPLEALVNKTAEYLLFDQLAAQRADGTKPPEKLVVLGETSPFGTLNSQFTQALPLNPDEQKRVEQIVNEERKDAVRVLSGMGHPTVVDMSRSDTFQHQSMRQRQLREDIALVFNTTNMEVNLTGAEGTSGRNTAESQERIDQAKGIGPIVKILERMYNNSIIPQRYGSGYTFDFDVEINEARILDILQKKVNTGNWTQNELRIERGADPIEDEEADFLTRDRSASGSNGGFQSDFIDQIGELGVPNV